MSFGQWPSDYLGVPINERFINFNPLTYFLYSGVDGAWFDPSDMSTMYQDAAGTTPVTALEQPVGKWLDKSGNGNHATQSITASRPTLSARYNLLTKTEDFAGSDWIKSNSIAVNIQSPDGSITAGRITNNSGTTNPSYVRATTEKSTAATYSHIVKVRKGSSNFIFIRDLYTADTPAYFNLNTGLFETVGSGLTAFVKSFIDGWYELVIISSGGTGTNLLDFGPASANNNNRLSNPGDYVDIWHPQLNVGATPLPYQRVNTATDYDSVGWPKYLKGDGIDDFFNLPFMNLYGNGACSIVAARDAVSQATDTYIISERSTTDVDPKYFPSRQLASGGNMDSYIVSDEGAVRLDTTGSAFGGAKLAAIHSVVDSGSNIKLFKDGAVVADDNYTRTGTLTLDNTTIGASVSTTTSNYANMRLYGLIITKSALSDTDRKRCEQYQARKLSKLGVTLA